MVARQFDPCQHARTMKRNSTVDDVAKAAGVARVTVSRVVNNVANVSPETRERVQRAVKVVAAPSTALARPRIPPPRMCVAIFGGAVLPVAVGAIADRFGLSMAFAVPLASYAFIAAFATAANRGNSPLDAAEPLRASRSPIP